MRLRFVSVAGCRWLGLPQGWGKMIDRVVLVAMAVLYSPM